MCSIWPSNDQSVGPDAIRAGAQQSGTVVSDIDETEKRRFQPAFKIVGHGGGKPRSVLLDGRPFKMGVDGNISLVEGWKTLGVQLLSEISGRKVELEIR